MIVMEMQAAPKIPEGDYSAKLIDIQEVASQWGGSLKFFFQIVDPGYEEAKVSGLCSKQLTPRTKLFRWLLAFGVNLTEGQRIDLEGLKGQPCIVELGIKPSSDGTEWANVVEVKSAHRHRVVPASPPPAQQYQQPPQQQQYQQPVAPPPPPPPAPQTYVPPAQPPAPQPQTYVPPAPVNITVPVINTTPPPPMQPPAPHQPAPQPQPQPGAPVVQVGGPQPVKKTNPFITEITEKQVEY